MIKKISVLLLLVLIFYYIYPPALPLFGYSFVFTLGMLGLILYLYHKLPYGETISMLLPYGVMFVWAYFCAFINNTSDSLIIEYTKSQIGWFFGAYLVIYVFFKVHPKGQIYYIMYYIIAAVVIQCIISIAMYLDPAIADFFNGIQKMSDLELLKREQTEGDRLVGYGVAFFGAGVICGVALIMIVYILVTRKLSMIKIIFFTILYCFIFYIGLLSARTTIVGLFVSLALMVVLLFIGRKDTTNQSFLFILLSVIFFSAGYTLCYVYFPDFADWAFEAFINYQTSGELRTHSSDALRLMMVFPQDMFTWLFGTGVGSYTFTDVGFSRLLLWFGLPGTIVYFFYQIVIVKQAFTNNKSLDLMLVVLIIYSIVLNYKGLVDLNNFTLLFAFYFLYYKYYIYTPYLYRLGKFNQTKLRFAVQTPAAGRGVQGNV